MSGCVYLNRRDGKAFVLDCLTHGQQARGSNEAESAGRLAKRCDREERRWQG